jgi:hypothetical protein
MSTEPTHLRVRIVDGDGVQHIADFPCTSIEQACVVCETLHTGMNILAMTGTYFCNSCWYKMGMRAVGGGAYAHLEKDVLFVGEMANVPACPTYDPNFGACTPFEIFQKVKGKPDLHRAIDECLGPHGHAITDDHLQDECTAILNFVSDEQFECLLKQGKL